MVEIQLSKSLASIQSRSALIKQIREAFQTGFGDDLAGLRGNVALITELLICVESVKPSIKVDSDKQGLFLDIYKSLFGQIEPNTLEMRMLDSICLHLREQGLIYRRTRFGNLIRGILKLFRA